MDCLVVTRAPVANVCGLGCDAVVLWYTYCVVTFKYKIKYSTGIYCSM
jgi:hypothetical protein